MGVLQITIAGVTLSWSLNFVSFLDVKQAALWVGLLVLSALNVLAGQGISGGVRALMPCWMVLLVTTIVGAARAPVPEFSFDEMLRLFPVLALATITFDLTQHPDCRRQILRAVCGTATCAAAMGIVQRFGGMSSFFPVFSHYDQPMYSVFGNEGLLAGFTALGLVALPAATRPVQSHATRIRLDPALLLAGGVMLATLLLTRSRGGQLAALSGLVGLVAFRIVSRSMLFGFLCCVVLLSFVLCLYLHVDPWDKWPGTFSAADTGGNVRNWILRASLALAVEHPILGCGLGNYARVIPIWLGAHAPEGGLGVNTLTNYHAHMDFLEWFCESGLVGLIGVGWVLSRIRLREPVSLSVLLAASVFSLTHPAFYSPPHALAALLCYSMNVSARPELQYACARPFSSRSCALIPFSIVLFGATVFTMTKGYPSYLLCRAEDRHLAGEAAELDYQRAVHAWGYYPEAHESYGIYAFEHQNYAVAKEQFELASIGLDSGRIYQLRAMAASALGDEKAACHWYTECLARWPWKGGIREEVRKRCAKS